MDFLFIWLVIAIAGVLAINWYHKTGEGDGPGLVLRVIGVGMIVAGLALAISSLGDFFNGIRSSRWPAAEARLIYVQEIDETPWWYRFWARPGRTAHRRVFRLYVGYEYFVNGEKYNSNGISFGSELDTPEHQRERFRRAKPLLAHYDAAKPGRAVLDAGITLGSAGSLLLGSVIMLLGGRMIVLTNASRRKRLTWVRRAAH